ncbi:hypothetical protein PVK06_042794 [Gossypium arboreum]|uniref:Uncharacterized protein n=1 Tax=Gossypium arboreum TaxID=29729 RepID=A0ABR0MNT4_GOSAR|nr:hypothetical protein PVK06_042794 [Gossypium arboreum]
MEGMLQHAFNMHSHGLQSFPPKIIASDDCDISGNAFIETGRSTPDEEPNGESAKFYNKFPSFASDHLNVRLGLASDGFNPSKIMNTSYSTWPIMLVPYNLPPWICMKQNSFILSMIIPRQKCLGNDINIYMQPLIEELKQLWAGVETYDVSRNKNFYLRANLLWTINDFPAYVNLSVRVSNDVMLVLVVQRKHVRSGYIMGKSSLTWGIIGG